MTPLTIIWNANPIAFSIGGIEIAWYGLLWSLSFVVGWWLFHKIVKHEGLNPELTTSAFFWVIIAAVIGARLGHCIFYDPKYYFVDHPFMSSFPYISLLDIRGGGLASHGGAIGILVGLWGFCRKWKIPYIWSLDRIGIVAAATGVLIRLGNLMNSEIIGSPTSLPWGFKFPLAGEYVGMPLDSIPYVHPTQLYEALAYLLIFGLLCWLYWRTKMSDRRGFMFGVLLVLMFGARFLIETIKEVQVDFERSMALDMGQILSIPFIVAGIVFLVISLRRPPRPYEGLPKAGAGTPGTPKTSQEKSTQKNKIAQRDAKRKERLGKK